MEPESPAQASPEDRPIGRDAGLLALAIVAVSFGAILARWTVAPALTIAFWRTFGGGLLLLPGSFRTTAPTTLWTRANRFWTTVGGAALALHFWSWLESLNHTSVAVSVTLVTTTPLFVAVSDRIMGRRLSRRSQLALLVALAGAVLLGSSAEAGDAAGTAGRLDPNPVLGAVLAIVGAAAMAIYLMAGAKLRQSPAAPASTAPIFLIAGAALFAGALAAGVNVFDLRSLDWVIVGAMILGPQLGGHAVLNHVVGRLGAMTVSLALLAEPVVSTLLAWLLLAERPTLLAVLGGVVVLAGLSLRSLDSRSTRDQRVSRAAASTS
ncbi:MAG: DMT family transporter [Actinomycetota bacterium]|nr:DMT family transporter [Actinomycetota bacterium]